MFPRVFIFAFCSFALLGNGFSQESPDVFSSMTREVQAIFSNAKGAVVKISGSDQHGRTLGSGFFIDPNGTIYTTYAVGGETTGIVAQIGNRKYPAKRLISDSRSGIALLKIEASTAFLPLGSSRDLHMASPVISIGYPMDLPLTPTLGFVGGFDLKYMDRYFTTTHIRANLSVQRGESGAPLLNNKGEVVGIVMSGIDGGSACYALPIEAAEKVRGDYTHYGEVRHGWIGITVKSNEDSSSVSSPKITSLLKDTPAFNSGLQDGDSLVRIGEVPIHKPEDVLNGSFFLTAGETVSVEVIRAGEHLTFNIQAADHPATEKVRVARGLTSSEDSLRLQK